MKGATGLRTLINRHASQVWKSSCAKRDQAQKIIGDSDNIPLKLYKHRNWIKPIWAVLYSIWRGFLSLMHVWASAAGGSVQRSSTPFPKELLIQKEAPDPVESCSLEHTVPNLYTIIVKWIVCLNYSNVNCNYMISWSL